MSNSKHTLTLDKDIELEITDIQIRDALDTRENLNLRLETPGNKGADPLKIIYVRMNMVVEKLNGAYESVCSANARFRVATAGMTAQQVRHYIHMEMRKAHDPRGFIGTKVSCVVKQGKKNPNSDTGANYPDTVYMNHTIKDNIADDEFEKLLSATDYLTTASGPSEATEDAKASVANV